MFIRYVAAEENSKNSKQLLDDVKNQIKEKQEKITNNKKESKEIDKTIAEMSEKLDRVSQFLFYIYVCIII